MESIEQTWYKILKTIKNNGQTHTKDDGDKLKEHLINHYLISNPLKKFGKQKITSEMFIKMIREGIFDIKDYPIKGDALADYVSALTDEKQIKNKNSKGENLFVYTYPERIFNMTQRNDDFMVNQFNLMASRLIQSVGSNRAVANIYSASKDCDQKDIPCLQIIQTTIRNNELMLHVFFRSNDAYNAFPANMFLLSYLGLLLTDKLKTKYPLLTFKGINYNSSSLHIYENDYPLVEKIIK